MGKHGNYHIFVVDDDPQVCKAVSDTLRYRYKVTSFPDAEACFKRLSESACKCDLLISDIKMPGMSGLELMQKVKQVRPLLEIVLITGYGEVPLAVHAIKAGANNFIEKPLQRDKLLQAAEAALQKYTCSHSVLGNPPLTEREKQVLKMVLDGMSNRQIAQALHRSTRTIEDHRRRIMRKLGAKSLLELVKMAQKMDLTGPD